MALGETTNDQDIDSSDLDIEVRACGLAMILRDDFNPHPPGEDDVVEALRALRIGPPRDPTGWEANRSMAARNQTFQLMALTPELRLEIYGQILGGRLWHFCPCCLHAGLCRRVDKEQALDHETCSSHNSNLDALTPFLIASRQVREEATKMLYRLSSFSFWSPESLATIFDRFPTQFKTEIRHIHLNTRFFSPSFDDLYASNANRSEELIAPFVKAALAPAIGTRLSVTGYVLFPETSMARYHASEVIWLNQGILQILRNISAYAYNCVHTDVYVDIRGMEFFHSEEFQDSIFHVPDTNHFFTQQDANLRLSRYVKRLLLHQVPRFDDWSGSLPRGFTLP